MMKHIKVGNNPTFLVVGVDAVWVFLPHDFLHLLVVVFF